VLTAGPVLVAGWAWSGFAPVREVVVSVDGGETWTNACLHAGERRGWRRWELAWQPVPGRHRILARATDERRLSQPLEAPWNAKGYLMNAMHEITVEIAP
jgi:hypothetical protein